MCILLAGAKSKHDVGDISALFPLGGGARLFSEKKISEKKK